MAEVSALVSSKMDMVTNCASPGAEILVDTDTTPSTPGVMRSVSRWLGDTGSSQTVCQIPVVRA